MSEHDAHNADVAAFLARLGSGEPTPGGGGAAAVAGAMGAGLVRMHALVTLEHEDKADHAKLMTAIAEQAEDESHTLLALVEEDARAYRAVLAAQALPRESDGEQAARLDALDEALRGACEVPLRILERCVEVIALSKTVVQHGAQSAAGDGAAGGELARSAMRVAGYCVKANLAHMRDTKYAEEARGRMDEIEYMGLSAATEIDSRVNDLWTAARTAPGS